MATLKTFEDIVVWQRARALCRRVYALTKLREFSRDFNLRDQINDSSGSIMDNIAEGFGRGGKKEFIQFLSYARGSADETRSQLYRALDRNYIDDKTFDEVKNEAMEIGRMITGFISYLQKADIKGSKFLEPEQTYNLSSKRTSQEDSE